MSLGARLLSDGGFSKKFMPYLPHCREPVFVDWREFIAVYCCQPYWSSREPVAVSSLSCLGIEVAYPATMASVVCSRQW